MGAVCLAVAGLAGADLINTASVSFRDGTGAVRTAISNTVIVAVTAPVLLAPVINGFTAFEAVLTAADSLTVELSGGAPDRLDWLFTPNDPNAGLGAGRSLSPPRAPPAPQTAMTRTPSIALGEVGGLTPGPWHVRVTATNASGTSAPAEADFTLVFDHLDAVTVYPNPWRSDRHGSRGITFGNLSAGTTIKIFNLSGQLVRTLSATGESETWDRRSETGETVSSGVYLYFMTDDQGRQRRGKFALIR